ncbi:MAG: TIGR01458 family HAD-type hydrolase, partial [Promethearchaeota archaeon]
MRNKELFDRIKGLLVDIDGTLYFKGSPIPGAIKAVSKLGKKGIKLLFLTNTDSKSPKTVLKILLQYGFSIKTDEIFTPIIALKKFLSKYPKKKSYFV